MYTTERLLLAAACLVRINDLPVVKIEFEGLSGNKFNYRLAGGLTMSITWSMICDELGYDPTYDYSEFCGATVEPNFDLKVAIGRLDNVTNW